MLVWTFINFKHKYPNEILSLNSEKDKNRYIIHAVNTFYSTDSNWEKRILMIYDGRARTPWDPHLGDILGNSSIEY